MNRRKWIKRILFSVSLLIGTALVITGLNWKSAAGTLMSTIGSYSGIGGFHL